MTFAVQSVAGQPSVVAGVLLKNRPAALAPVAQVRSANLSFSTMKKQLSDRHGRSDLSGESVNSRSSGFRADFVRHGHALSVPDEQLSSTPEDLSVRLKHLGIHGLTGRHFYTSALNTADFLSETDPQCTVFVIGEGGILTALHGAKDRQ